jgi:hypothetical protein
VRAWRRSRLAVDVLAVRLAELRVPNVTRHDSLYLASDLLGKKELRREHEVRRASGLPSRLQDRNTLREEFGISRAAALLGYGDLVIDPRKAAIGLLRAAVGNGARSGAPRYASWTSSASFLRA